MTGSAPDWSRVRTVVFDVDGTLYDSRRLRRVMARQIAAWLALRPHRIRDILALQAFRRERERLADREAVSIRRLQYEVAARASGLPQARIRRIVDEWIRERPLPHLARARVSGVAELFAELRTGGREIAVWSDYAAKAKLEALGLAADLVVSAEDPEVDRMKPHPAGLDRILEVLGRDPHECLVIGDRDDRDGEAARRRGIPYLLFTAGADAGPGEFADYSTVLSTLRQR